MLIATGANGIVWTGSRAAGIDRFDSVTGKVINFRNLPGDPRDIGDDHIVDIIVGRAGDVWAATRASGLARINGQTLEVTRFHASAEGDHRIPGDAMNFVFEDASGRIWAGTDQGWLPQVVRANVFRRRFSVNNMQTETECQKKWHSSSSASLVRKYCEHTSYVLLAYSFNNSRGPSQRASHCSAMIRSA